MLLTFEIELDMDDWWDELDLPTLQQLNLGARFEHLPKGLRHNCLNTSAGSRSPEHPTASPSTSVWSAAVSGTQRELAAAIGQDQRRSSQLTINRTPPPSGGHDRSDWEFALRAATVAAWVDPRRRDCWHDYHGIAPDDPAEAHRSELVERLGILGTIFDGINRPLHLFRAEAFISVRVFDRVLA
jgi:hypothetical protein